MTKNKRNKGFTLVELLVVIAIIGILATIVTMNVTGAIARSRDGRRKEDIATINKAIGLFYINNSTTGYPKEDTCGSSVASSYCDPTWEYIQGDQTTGSDNSGIASGTTLKTNFSKYLPTLPTDPLNSDKGSIRYKYLYYSNNSATPRIYVIKAFLEINQGGNFGNGKCFGFIKGAQWTDGTYGSGCL